MLLITLFTAVLSTKDCKNTYKSNKRLNVKKKRFFVSCLFLIFCWEIIVQKIRVLAFITRSVVLFFFFAYRSAEGDESVSFESSLLLLFLLKEEREKKKLVIESSFFYQLFPRKKYELR